MYPQPSSSSVRATRPFLSLTRAYTSFPPHLSPEYVHDVLDDASRYAEHRDASPFVLNQDDVRLAVQSRVDFTSSGPPPREVLPTEP